MVFDLFMVAFCIFI